MRRSTSIRSGAPVAILASALAWVIACAAPPATEVAWEARMAEGELTRAREALERGEHQAGRRHAEQALQLARDAAALPTVGRALLLLGDLDADLLRLDQAAATFAFVDEHAGCAAAHIRIAELLLDGGRAGAALSHLALAADREAQLSNDRIQSARLAARRHHLAATALRLTGRADAAEAEERQASLALTMLPDDEFLMLRQAVAAARGNDAVAASKYEEALRWHARASETARRLGDGAAELSAIMALAGDLVALGRLDDALHHHLQAMDLARKLGDEAGAVRVARKALALLDSQPPGDSRRARFEAELDRAAAAPSR
jgi:tetratricopeptide (TPR) repeat protein